MGMGVKAACGVCHDWLDTADDGIHFGHEEGCPRNGTCACDLCYHSECCPDCHTEIPMPDAAPQRTRYNVYYRLSQQGSIRILADDPSQAVTHARRLLNPDLPSDLEVINVVADPAF